ncbi:M15 family metallopeptidase [Burkholderia oklahomensis]|nr:M15 family metallopeptidase [Burkholderia oklahomensis]AOI42759.1 D-alanyl-D-alanine carboxypeptidase [Burkholderia oklahomensis EO147]KUY54501.1 D-alanyl-D-alanine carboxypeptidase [Burkholderia oklahomensis EO147]QPS37500.1 M15 family metallopeptidase [Burkholderia oklahomensis]
MINMRLLPRTFAPIRQCAQHSTALFVLLSVFGALNAHAGISRITTAQCSNMHAGGVINENSPVQCDRLRNVSFDYVNFDGWAQKGEVVVLDAVADRVQTIFDTLYRMRFPLNKAVPVERYRGDDDASMNDNNTSAFNSRRKTGRDEWSMHAYGVAIDVNPHQNPYVSFGDDGLARVLPASAAKTSMNRLDKRPNKPARPGMAERVVDVFASNGFLRWGGYWDDPIDYQHFEAGSRALVARMVDASPDDARRMFERYVASYANCLAHTALASHAAARAACIGDALRE